MPRETVLLLVFNNADEKIFDERKFVFLELTKGIESLMRKENWWGKIGIGLNEFLNGSLSTDIFELKDGLVPQSDLLILIDELLIVDMSVVLLH